jgi:hypothetical protein
MLSALIDNSTLTAVQRIIGDVPVAYSYPIEGDLAAYDQYLQALLLYDELAAIDDYKEEYKLERKGSFREIRFLNLDNIAYSEASSYAEEALLKIIFEIQKGKIKPGPLSEFLKSLGLHVAPAWYMSSSDWFLNVRILSKESDLNIDKYGALMSVISSQNLQSSKSVGDIGAVLKIEDGEGRKVDVINKGHRTVDDDIKHFSSSLNWIAFRSVFYLYLSSTLKSALVLHPIRHAYLGQYVLKQVMTDLAPNIRAELGDFFQQNVSSIKFSSDRMIGDAACSLQLPFFAAWAVGYAGNPKNGYDHVLQIRESPDARNLRSHFREIEALTDEVSQIAVRRETSKLYSAINSDIERLSTRFQGRKPNAGLGVSVNLLSMTPSISIPSIFERAKGIIPSSRSRSPALLRNIANDFINIPALGRISDDFKKSRRFAKGTQYVPDRTRVEPKRYQMSSTWFKEPL